VLAQETVDTVAWEIIVVDNNSKDETRETVEKLCEMSRVPLRYVFERRQGLGYARNAGIHQARGEVIAFTDDDIVVDKFWLRRILEQFESDSTLAFLAGRVEPLTGLSPNVANTRCRVDVALDRMRSLDGMVVGGNMAVARAICIRLGGFDTRLGAGRGLACEDIDFAYRLLRAGFRGRFSVAPVVYHDAGFRDRQRENLRGWGAFYLKHLLYGDPYVVRKAWWELRRIGKDLFCHHGSQISRLQETVQLVTGALIMAMRMGASLFTIGETVH
jgi:glycosyltransferase involved in cell wall biosynthesis